MPLQILRVGKLAIIGAPVEFTTMAGRRVRAAVLAALGGAELGWRVVLAGLANTYSSYCATPEEYAAQRYEAASTLYGPHTLDAYVQFGARCCCRVVYCCYWRSPRPLCELHLCGV